MTPYCRAHPGNGLRKFCYSLELAELLSARVVCVVEILPTSRCIFPNRLNSSLCGGVDKDVSPCRRNFQFVNSFLICTRKPSARRFVAKSSFRRAQPAYADILQPFDLCHSNQPGFGTRNEICLCIGRTGESWSVRKVTLSKRIGPQNESNVKPPAAYNVICSWCGALIRSTNVESPEQMCLICHARMLNDYFQRVRKKATDLHG